MAKEDETMNITVDPAVIKRIQDVRKRLDPPDEQPLETWTQSINRILDHLEVLQERIYEDHDYTDEDLRDDDE
jgi:hypothetical protein